MPDPFLCNPYHPDHHFDLSRSLFPFSSRYQARNSATIIPSTSPIAPSFLPPLYFPLPIAKGAGFVPHLVFITSVIRAAALRNPTTHFTHDPSSLFSFLFFFLVALLFLICGKTLALVYTISFADITFFYPQYIFTVASRQMRTLDLQILIRKALLKR